MLHWLMRIGLTVLAVFFVASCSTSSNDVISGGVDGTFVLNGTYKEAAECAHQQLSKEAFNPTTLQTYEAVDEYGEITQLGCAGVCYIVQVRDIDGNTSKAEIYARTLSNFYVEDIKEQVQECIAS